MPRELIADEPLKKARSLNCEQNAELLAAIEAFDSGKPFNGNAKGDVAGFITVLRYYAGWADKITGKTIDAVPGKKLAYTLHDQSQAFENHFENHGINGNLKQPWTTHIG